MILYSICDGAKNRLAILSFDEFTQFLTAIHAVERPFNEIDSIQS